MAIVFFDQQRVMPLAEQHTIHQQKLNAAAQAGDISLLYGCIQDDPHILDGIDKIPYVDTPLHIAASAGHAYFALEMARLMPSFGKKLNPEGLSPLHLALQNGHSDIVSRLINFDKELIRVKGRESFTPLHYVAKIGDIDLLAEFLCIFPESIRDQTIQNKTAVHIAVENYNLEAFKVLLGWLRRINKQHVLSWKNDKGNTVLHIGVVTLQPQIVKLLVKKYSRNINGKNSIGLTALDVAESLDDGVIKTEIVNALRSAGASEGSSLHDVCSLAEFLKSGEPFWERGFGYIIRVKREMSMEMRNMILVVAVLIATATFQAVLSPPGGVPDNTNGTVSPNLPAANNTITVVANITTTNPSNRVLLQGYGVKLTYKYFFFLFYFLNTVCFAASVTVIIIVLHYQIVSIFLHMSLIFLALSYGMSFLVISPSWFYALIVLVVSYNMGLFVYVMKYSFLIIEQLSMIEGDVPLMSYLHPIMQPLQKLVIMQRLQMLHRVLDNP